MTSIYLVIVNNTYRDLVTTAISASGFEFLYFSIRKHLPPIFFFLVILMILISLIDSIRKQALITVFHQQFSPHYVFRLYERMWPWRSSISGEITASTQL